MAFLFSLVSHLTPGVEVNLAVGWGGTKVRNNVSELDSHFLKNYQSVICNIYHSIHNFFDMHWYFIPRKSNFNSFKHAQRKSPSQITILVWCWVSLLPQLGSGGQLKHTVIKSSQDFQTGAQPSNQPHRRGGGTGQVWGLKTCQSGHSSYHGWDQVTCSTDFF